MQHLLTDTANRLARTTGFIERQRKFTGALFAKTLVFGWLSDPEASLDDLAQTAATLGTGLTAQALDARFDGPSGKRAARFLEALLGEAARVVVEGAALEGELVSRFNGVYLIDTTVAGLPAAFADRWPGLGGNTATAGQAALKLEVVLDLRRGGLCGPRLLSGRTHDAAGPLARRLAVPKGALRIADLGYFSLDRFAAMNRQRAYWLSRLRTQTALYSRQGQRLRLVALLEKADRQGQERFEWPVRLGAKQRIAARLLAERVPDEVAAERRRKLRRASQVRGQTPSKRSLLLCGWTLWVTNAGRKRLSFAEAKALYRARWQIELLFKRWKSGAGVGRSRSQKPWRLLCETYAKLVAMVVAHWIAAKGLWHLRQKSLGKALKTVRRHALHLAAAMASRGEGATQEERRLGEALKVVLRCLQQAGCRMNRRRKHPNTYQLLEDPSVLEALT